MKSLADLKREGHLYEWSLISNSLYPTVPEFQKEWRAVGRIQSNALTLLTNKDGKLTESWIDFPKASEIQLGINENEGILSLTITRNHKGWTVPHVMVYKLRPNLNLIGIAN